MLGVQLPAPEFGVQAGEVAFQQRPVDPGDAGDVDVRAGQPGGEPGEDPCTAGRDARAQAGGQPPPAPPFGQVLQPGLRDAAEAHVRDRVVDAEVTQPPGVAGVFHVPAAPEGQVLGLPAGVDDQRPGRGRGDTGLAGRRLVLPPPVLVPVQQGRDTGAGGEVDRPLGLDRVHLRLPGVAAALERVLPFQPQLGAERPQADAVAAKPGLITVAVAELSEVRAAVPGPCGGVGMAEHAIRAGPQPAAEDQAGDRRVRRRHGLPRGQPGTETGLAVAAVAAGVPGAEPQHDPAVLASGHLAGQRCRPRPPVRAGAGDECREVRFLLAPLLVVPDAQAPVPPGPLAAFHQARRAAENRIPRVESEGIAAELRPDRGHQRGQKPRVCGWLAGCLPGGHPVTSVPGNTVAVTLTATPLRIARARR